MRQGRKILLGCMVLALFAIATMPATNAEAARRAATSERSTTKRVGLHQFTGTVTAIDKSSLTVEKTGKLAKTMVFVRHAEMKTTGDLEKDARVTVWYRDEGGKSVAHKVVVKSDKTAAAIR